MKLLPKHFNLAIAAYGLVHLVFIVLPSFLKGYHLSALPLSGEELLEFLTPTAVFLVYLTIYFFVRQYRKSVWLDGLFLVGSTLWLHGFAMNQTANYLSNTLTSSVSVSAQEVMYFYDEVLSHLLNSLGYCIIFGIFAYLAPMVPEKATSRSLLASFSALLTGIVMFLVAVESKTVILYLVLTLSTTFYVWMKAKTAGHKEVLSIFILIASFTTLFMLVSWGLWHGGFPEFSQLGWV